MSAPRVHQGFTLLELVLVLMVLALVLAAAAPSLGGWNRGQRLDNAADQVLSAARWARSQAIATATPHRLEINASEGVFRVTRQEAQGWTAAPGEFEIDRTLPPTLSFEITRQDESGTPAIDFYPNGRVSPGTIHISAEWGEVITLQSSGAAESLRRLSDTGGG